jgi:Tfp pilus assembly protein PilO
MKHSTARLISFTAAMLFLVGAWIVFMNLVRPAYKEAQDLKAEKLSRENFYENQQTMLAQFQEIEKAYKGNGNPQTVVSLAFPQTKDEANLLNQLESMASRNNVAVQSITVSTPGARQTNSVRGATASSSLVRPIGVISVQARLTGTYASFKSFLSAAETNLRIIDITALSIAPVGKSSQDFYSFDVNFDSYYQNP